MIRAAIVTRWAGTGVPTGTPAGNPCRPAVADAHPVQRFEDITGGRTPAPAPGVLVIKAEMQDSDFSALLADANYGPRSVLWSEAI